MLLCPTCKKIVAVHDVIPHDGNKGMALSNFFTCHLSDLIILRNKKYKEKLAESYKIPINKIYCMDMVREWLPYTPPKFSGIFLYFGRIRKYKGLDKLKQIIEMNPDIKFRVVGEPDEYNREFVSQIKLLPNAAVIDVEVTDEEMRNEFINADWVILPYSSATQSGVIVDAYKYSRPVICFNVGAITEQIIDGKTGYIIPSDDVIAFSEKIRISNHLQDDVLV